jgi:hypothetical protein
VAMEQAATTIAFRNQQVAVRPIPKCMRQYRPVFSFSAITINGLLQVLSALERLAGLCEKVAALKFTGVVDGGAAPPASVSKLRVPLPSIQERVECIASCVPGGTTHVETVAKPCGWTAAKVFAEHLTNQKLEPLGATRSLLFDIAVAAASFADGLEEALRFLNSDETQSDSYCQYSSRQRKQMTRVAVYGCFVLDVYSFSAYVATLQLDHALAEHCDQAMTKVDGHFILTERDLTKAAERTRMVVSTMSTFINANAQRAWKAADQYTKGAIIKRIVALRDATAAEGEPMST